MEKQLLRRLAIKGIKSMNQSDRKQENTVDPIYKNIWRISSIVLSVLIISVSLLWSFLRLSTDDCVTTTVKYANGSVVSEKVCE
jgi:hypothetical protein